MSVSPPDQQGHTTYRLAEEPEIGTLWTYAEPNPDGSFRHVGGGSYDAATNTWGQGAFNADDMSRAAVVYLRHWQATGSTDSRDAAYQMLRGLTYLQTTTPGEDAGNVVLWMQPDGTLNPSAEPKELPDPSDSDASYWLARTIWALGEGYAAFEQSDPEFAAFLGDRLDLAVDAVDRQVLDRYGRAPRHRRRAGPRVADRQRRRRHRGGGARALGVRRRRRLHRGPLGPVAAERGRRGDAGRRRPALADGLGPPLGGVPFGLACLGRQCSGRAGQGLGRARGLPRWPTER